MIEYIPHKKKKKSAKKKFVILDNASDRSSSESGDEVKRPKTKNKENKKVSDYIKKKSQ